MLVEAEGRTSWIEDGGPPWGHAGYLFLKLPLILDGHVISGP